MVLQPAAKLSGNTGLSHTPLSSQQYVVAVSDPGFQDLQLALAIEEVFPAYPAAGR